VTPQGQASDAWRSLAETLHLRCTICDDAAFDLTQAREYLTQQFGADAGWRDALSPLALQAAGAIVHYVQAVYKSALRHLTGLRPYRLSQYMVLDAITRRNLELVRTLRQGARRGSLLKVLDATVTSMGARLLQRWVEQPLLQPEAIRERLDAVAALVADTERRQQLRQVLRGIYDIERLVGRIACGTANARALLALRDALEALPQVRETLAAWESPLLRALRQDCVGEENLVSLLQQTIVDEPPVTLRDGGLIRTGYDPGLDQLIEETERHKRWIARLQNRERQHTGIKSLKVGFNQVFGYYIEVSKPNLNLVPDHYKRKQTLSNGERYITDNDT
jgi:DNA mismatch repair protein MutS